MLWGGKKETKKKKKTVRPRSSVGAITVWAILAVVMAFYEFTFIMVFQEEGALGLFPPIVAMFAMFMTLLTSITYTKTMLFEAKDHDMLFSLPVSGGTVVAAKIATMYTLDSVLNIIMLVPCAVLYGVLEKPPFSFYLYFIVLMFFVSLIPILIASIISALISIIASRFRHAQVVTIILSTAFLFGVMMVSFNIGSSAGSEEEMAMISPMIAEMLDNLGSFYLPIAWYREAVIEGSLSSALLFVGVSLLAFAIVAFVFGKFYGKIHEMFRPRVIRRKYKSAEKASGMLGALMKKDMKRLFSSANIFMNQLTGVLMLVVFAVMFSIQNFGAEDEVLGDIFSIIFPFIFALAATMVCDTTTAISLEGKMFPLLKSLPVPPNTILRAKIMLHMLFCAPVIVVCGIVVSIVNGLPILGMIATVVIPLCYAYMSGVAGLLINLKKYKFDWTNEITIVKNSLPMVVTMIGGMVLSLLPMGLAVLLYILSESLSMVLGIFTALAVCFAALAYFMMRAVGEKWFLKIEY